MDRGEIALAPLTGADWPEAARIYQEGIDTGNATFEARAPGWAEFEERCAGMPALRARERSGRLVGWAALSPASRRHVYRGVGEVSIYVGRAHAGRGVGRALLDGLVAAAEKAGIWTMKAGIFPENEPSIALHERCGFRRVGVQERVGRMPDGRWRDVCLYERRSHVVGV